MNTNKTESIKFFYNGIKVNGGKLIRCFYFTDSDSVTISARDYADLPRDMFKVKNETDLYTDYFDTDSATMTSITENGENRILFIIFYLRLR